MLDASEAVPLDGGDVRHVFDASGEIQSGHLAERIGLERVDHLTGAAEDIGEVGDRAIVLGSPGFELITRTHGASTVFLLSVYLRLVFSSTSILVEFSHGG